MSYKMHTEPTGLDIAVKRILNACRKLKRKGIEFDTIYVTGQSGIVPGSVVAWKLGKKLMLLRKDEEVSHGQQCEGAAWFDGENIVIVDDFIASGKTLMRMLGHAKAYRRNIVAVVLYANKMRPDEERQGFLQEYEMRVHNPRVKLVRIHSWLFQVVEEKQEEVKVA